MTDTPDTAGAAMLGAAACLWAVTVSRGAADGGPALAGLLVLIGVFVLAGDAEMSGPAQAAEQADDGARETAWYEPHDCLRGL